MGTVLLHSQGYFSSGLLPALSVRMGKRIAKITAIILLGLFALLVDLPKEQLAKVGLDDTWFGKTKYQLGLDLQGGTQLRYRIDLSGVFEKDRDQIVDGIRTVIEKRVNGLGVSEPL